MSKSTKVVPPVQAPAEAKPAPTPVVIKSVKPGLKFRGARAAWYAELLAHEGKPLTEFIKATTEKPPSVPKSGVAENPTGWVGYFARTQVATIG